MKRLKKLIAGLLLAFGVPLSILAVTQILNPQTSQQDREDALTALILLTLPPTAVGGWLVQGLQKDHQKKISDRLRTTFYRLVKEGNGQITILRFAMEAELSGEEARQYLDQKAKEFNGTFDALDQGDIAYRFNL
jgi:hypothetical protein